MSKPLKTIKGKFYQSTFQSTFQSKIHEKLIMKSFCLFLLFYWMSVKRNFRFHEIWCCKLVKIMAVKSSFKSDDEYFFLQMKNETSSPNLWILEVLDLSSNMCTANPFRENLNVCSHPCDIRFFFTWQIFARMKKSKN